MKFCGPRACNVPDRPSALRVLIVKLHAFYKSSLAINDFKSTLLIRWHNLKWLTKSLQYHTPIKVLRSRLYVVLTQSKSYLATISAYLKLQPYSLLCLYCFGLASSISIKLALCHFNMNFQKMKSNNNFSDINKYIRHLSSTNLYVTVNSLSNLLFEKLLFAPKFAYEITVSSPSMKYTPIITYSRKSQKGWFLLNLSILIFPLTNLGQSSMNAWCNVVITH